MASEAVKSPKEGTRARNRWRLSWLLPILLLIVWVGDRTLNGSNGEAHHQRLEQELRVIPAPPNSKVIANLNFFSVWNSHRATVGSAYSTQLRQSDIRDFYDRELVALGWRTMATDSGTGRSYCKGDIAALLRFENNLPARASYVLSLDWPGGRSCR